MITPHQLTALALRLFALWLAFTGARIALVSYALGSSAHPGTGTPYGIAALYALSACMLWMFPMFIARRLVPVQAGSAPAALDAINAGAIAFLATGLLVIAVKALTPVANYLSLLVMLATSGQTAQLKLPGIHADGFIGLAMLALGMVLVVKCRSLARRVLPEEAATKA